MRDYAIHLQDEARKDSAAVALVRMAYGILGAPKGAPVRLSHPERVIAQQKRSAQTYLRARRAYSKMIDRENRDGI